MSTTAANPPVTAIPDAPVEEPSPTGGVGKHVLIYGLGIILSKAIGFIMLPIYTRYLTPADYGVMELIQMTLDVISIAAGAQIAGAIFRFYHKTDSQAEKNAVVATAMLALAISYTTVGAISFIGADRISGIVFGTNEHADLLRIASISVAFQSLLMVPLTYARMRDWSGLFVVANAIKLLISLVLNLLFVVEMEMGVRGIFLSGLASNLVVGVSLTWLVVREVGFAISSSATRDLLRYGLPLVGMHVANFISTFSDRYFLQANGDATMVGLYTLAYQFGFILALIGYMPFGTVWEPKRFEISTLPNRDALYARGFVQLNVLSWTTGVGISLFVGDMLRVMSAPAFHSAADLVPIILIAYILQGWTSLQDIGILIREKTEYVTLAHWSGAVVALIGYVVLIPRYLGLGAAVATVLAFSVRHAAVYVISQRLWPVRYDWPPVLRLIGAAVAVALVGVLLPDLPVATSLALRALLFLVFLAAVWTLRILAPEEKRSVHAAVRSAAALLRVHLLRRAPSTT